MYRAATKAARVSRVVFFINTSRKSGSIVPPQSDGTWFCLATGGLRTVGYGSCDPFKIAVSVVWGNGSTSGCFRCR